MSEPNIKLLTSTENPLEVMAYAWHVMQNDVPDTLEEFKEEHSQEFLNKQFIEIVKDGVGTPAEFVSVVFVLKNVSRALQQQITRYRHSSFSIQTLRRVDVGNFAKDGNYHTPKSLDRQKEMDFDNYMADIQQMYRRLIDSGASVEDARGILPLNIYSTITMSCNIRELANIVKQRLCFHTQEEWKEVVNQMEKEMRENMPPIIADELFMPLCKKTGKCFFPDRCCGKGKV